MVFDWCKAAQLIKEHKSDIVRAGLHGDWDWTGGLIFKDGKPVPEEDTYVYLQSTWATPEIEIDEMVEDCFVTHPEREEWSSKTYWPQIALDILYS